MSERAGLFAVAIDRPVATTMVVLAVTVFGTLAYGRLRVALMPELSYPTLTVRTEYDGAAPEEVEREVSRPLEEALRTVEDLAEIRSVSRADGGDVVLEFQWGASMDQASQKVRERLEVVELPDGAQRPTILRYDPDLDPVLRLGLSGEASLTALRRFADEDAKRVLEKIPGVAMVRISGGEEPIVRIEVDKRRLAQRGLTIAQLLDRLRQENVNLAGGRLDDGSLEYMVRTLSEFRHVDEIRDLIVGVQGSVPVRLSEVARVSHAVREREVITRIGARESVEIELFKEADANLVAVSAAVRERVFGAAPVETSGEPAKEDAKGPGERGAGPAPLVAELPAGMTLEVLSDRAVFIRAAVDEVVDTAVLGGLLAILVLWLFLRSLYVTSIISLAIPLSVVTTFGALYLADVTLNVMSLGGLALGIGMLVDNAVVVLESIHRCGEEGDAPRAAAIRGVQEVGGAVVASTLTTVAVFFPIVFVEGIAGQVFGDLAFAVVFSLLASLAVALYFIPMLAARAPAAPQHASDAARERPAESGSGAAAGAIVEPTPKRFALGSWTAARDEWATLRDRWRRGTVWSRLVFVPVELLLLPYRLVRTAASLLLEVTLVLLLGTVLSLLLAGLVRVLRLARNLARLLLSPLLWLFEAGWSAVATGHRGVLAASLRHRAAVLTLSAALLWGSWTLLDDLGAELIPALHQGELIVDVALPVETALADTAERVAAIEEALHALELVERTSSVVGVRDDAARQSDEGANTARITIILESAPDLERLEREAIAALRGILSRQPGVTYEVRRPTLLSLRTPLEVEVRADDLAELRGASRSVLDAMRSLPTLADVRSSLARGYPEIHVTLDRDALALHGLNARQVADAVRNAVLGATPTSLRTTGRRVDLVVRLDRSDVADRNDLQSLYVRPADARPAVALGSVATVSPPTEGPSEIRHVEGQRVVLIEANPSGADLSVAAAQVTAAIEALRLPPQVRTRVAGQSGEMDVARRSLGWAMALAVFLVYIVMAARFESLAGPFVILLTIPLAAIGVVGALWVTRTPVSVVVLIGGIMLAGIVVNNAIVLVDYIIQLRARGAGRLAAIRTACEVRLRPVVITTLTTVLGLVPMALGLGEGAEIRAPMAIAVMAGLTCSTLLTLVVVPVVYSLIGEAGRAPRAASPPEGSAPAQG